MRTTYTHVGAYQHGFTDQRARYVVTTTRRDGEPITSDILDKAKRANIRAARRLGLVGTLATRPLWDSVTIGSFTVRGATMVAVESLERDS